MLIWYTLFFVCICISLLVACCIMQIAAAYKGGCCWLLSIPDCPSYVHVLWLCCLLCHQDGMSLPRSHMQGKKEEEEEERLSHPSEFMVPQIRQITIQGIARMAISRQAETLSEGLSTKALRLLLLLLLPLYSYGYFMDLFLPFVFFIHKNERIQFPWLTLQ